MNQRPITGQGTASRRVWLCADDFALNDAISEAILTLLAAGRLSITSCMTQAPGWSRWGTALRDAGYASRAGLHFNLTEPIAGIQSTSLGKLMLKSSVRWLDRDAIRSTLRHQLDDYENVIGAQPSFVDGHQHVHVFHGVRDILLEELNRRYTQLPWLRNVMPPHDPLAPRSPKLKVILAIGGSRFAEQLHAHTWPSNSAFAGLYNLKPTAPFASLMQGWLASLRLEDSGLIMCHPALRAESGDVIGDARSAEYAWLSSDAWPAMLRNSGMELALTGRFTAI